MDKKITYLCVALVIGILVYMMNYVSPYITINTDITKLSDDDVYRITHDNSVQESDINKYRHIKITVNTKSAPYIINNIEVEKNNLADFFKYSTDIIPDGGGASGYPNGNKYSEDEIVFLANATDEQLIKFIGEYKIKFTWKNIFGRNDSKIFYIKDIIIN